MLSGKRVLIFTRSNANRALFEPLLPPVNAVVNCAIVEHGASRIEVASADQLERADIIVAELSLIAALLHWVQGRAKPPLIVAQTTPPQYGVCSSCAFFVCSLLPIVGIAFIESKVWCRFSSL